MVSLIRVSGRRAVGDDRDLRDMSATLWGGGRADRLGEWKIVRKVEASPKPGGAQRARAGHASAAAQAPSQLFRVLLSVCELCDAAWQKRHKKIIL